MSKITITFSAILVAVLICNGVNSSENSVAVPQPLSPLTALIDAILNPMLKALQNIVNVIVRIIRNLEDVIFGSLPKIIIDLVNTITDLIRNTTSEAVRGVLQAILDLIRDEVSVILELIKELGDRQNALQQILVDIENTILDAIDDIRKFLGNCLNKIPVQAIKIVRRLTSDLTKCASGTIELISNELKRVNEIAESVTDLVDDVLGEIVECLEDDEEKEVVECLEDIRKSIGESLKEIEDELRKNSSVNDTLATVQQCIQAVLNVANSTLTC